MTNPNSVENPSAIVARVQSILLKPKEEWPVIEAEPTSISELFLRYALLLAAIPALASFLRGILFGYSALGFTYRPGFVASLGMGITQYVMSLLSVAIIALITDFIVGQFGGTSNRINAFKLAVYGSTAAWLAGIFMLIPGLGFLGILGLYSIYLLYTGLPVLMKVPQEKAIMCTAAITVLAIIVSFVASAIIGPVSSLFGGMNRLDAPSSGTMTVPGVGTIDTGKLEDASKKMEAAANNAQNAKPVDPVALKALLPASLGAYTRGEMESTSMGAAGVGGSQASGSYSSGDKQLRVELTDMAAVGALTGLGAALNVNSSKETASGFERTRSENGQMVTEKWDNDAKNGSYSTTVANRFMVTVEGDASSFDELKAAASTIDMGKLASLAE